MPVAAYKTADWPAFYTANSGFKAPMTLDSARQVAETIRTFILPALSHYLETEHHVSTGMTERLSLPASLCLGNPIPAEFHAVGEELQRAVEQAVAESVENGMARSGPRSTPWLLQRVNELTEGKSLESSTSSFSPPSPSRALLTPSQTKPSSAVTSSSEARSLSSMPSC